MSKIVSTTRRHATSLEAYADVAFVLAQHENGEPSEPFEIEDATALAIASWWASPGTEGRAFAELATTGAVDMDALSRDIGAVYPQSDYRDSRALDCLGTWALNHPSRD